ncbi:MAG TPA: ATP-dependent DNA helicase RecG, partial [Steroidobacteraceae bacterium]|nr:ATP-dependent DNA helicase RecG [Steroidobacteraceae bacterium]
MHPAPGVARELTAPEQRPVTALRGVGESLAGRLARLGVFTLQDLLFLLPLRYEDRTRVVPIGTLTPGVRAVIEAQVQLTEVVFRGRRQLLSRVADGSGFLTLRFFHFNQRQQESLARGARLRCFGEVRRGPLGLEIVHPEYRLVDAEMSAQLDEALTPIYPGTEGVQQGRLRKLAAQALEAVREQGLTDWLPPTELATSNWPALLDALEYVHRPPVDARLDLLSSVRHPAQRRLACEELLAHQLSLKLLRREIRSDPAVPLPRDALAARLLASLPFQLTGAQRRAYGEVLADIREPRPMLRLVQGDVGCGKTIVAALAAAHAVEADCQAALMAPTELLAEQHLRNFERWFGSLGIKVALLTGKLQGRARDNAMRAIASGAARIVIGTHALFQEGVRFRRLALAIVDEQHRFGVHQRLQLRDKGAHDGRHPHQLIMTATPIPRTLAMTAYADLDVSVIDELPPGRSAVQTVVLPQSRRDEVIARIRDTCVAGRQVYWVCPLIDESDSMPYQAAEETAAALAEALPGMRVGIVHGRMTPAQKDGAMERFRAGELQLLVATTVIEVGVDVPNASLMVIENAERMGLAQLHQLRGRVGRGSHASSCVLLYRPPLSELG